MPSLLISESSCPTGSNFSLVNISNNCSSVRADKSSANGGGNGVNGDNPPAGAAPPAGTGTGDITPAGAAPPAGTGTGDRGVPAVTAPGCPGIGCGSAVLTAPADGVAIIVLAVEFLD